MLWRGDLAMRMGKRSFHSSLSPRNEAEVPKGDPTPTPPGGEANPQVPTPDSPNSPDSKYPPTRHPVHYQQNLLEKLRIAIAGLTRVIVKSLRAPYLFFFYQKKRTKVILLILASLFLMKLYQKLTDPGEDADIGEVRSDWPELMPNNADWIMQDGFRLLVEEKLMLMLFESQYFKERFGQCLVDKRSVLFRYLPKPFNYAQSPSTIQALSLTFMVFGEEAIGEVVVTVDVKVVPRYGSVTMYDVICKFISIGVYCGDKQDNPLVDLKNFFGDGPLDNFFRPYLYTKEKITGLKLKDFKYPPPPTQSEMDLPDSMFEAPPPMFVPETQFGIDPYLGGRGGS